MDATWLLGGCDARSRTRLSRRPPVADPRAPGDAREIAEAAGVDESTVRARMQDLVALSDTRSLDADLQSGIVEPAEVRPDAAWQLEEAELMGSVREAVSALPEPLRSIVARSYWGNARLVDIAADMGITTQRVAQYRAEAITALSAWFSRLYEEVSAPDDHSQVRLGAPVLRHARGHLDVAGACRPDERFLSA